MTDSMDEIKLELERLRLGLDLVKERNNFAVPFVLTAASGVSAVLNKACQVLSIVDQKTLDGCSSITEWRECLPAWFLLPFSVERSKQENDAWLRMWRELPPAAKAKAETEKGWSLEGWLYWLEPENRQWYLWSSDSDLDNDERIVLLVQAIDFPFASKSLVWLFKCSGASNFDIHLD